MQNDIPTIIADREERLKAINATLETLGLKKMPKLGDASKGEIELLYIKEIHAFASRFFTYVKFGVTIPGVKDEGEFSVRFNANGSKCDGAVIVVMINGRFAIVRQWRTPLGRHTYETPRGFSEKLDTAYRANEVQGLGLSDLPIGTVLRELDQEVLKGAKLTGLFHLGDVAENSGTNAVVPSYFLVQIEVPQGVDLGGSDEKLKVLLWEPQQVADEIGGKICDSHSITAFALARKKLAAVGQL